MAIFPWLVSHEKQGQDLEDYPDLKRWYEGMESRPAVGRALEVGKELRRSLDDMDDDTRRMLFVRVGGATVIFRSFGFGAPAR